LENCTIAAARYRIEYCWPLLDLRLIKLFLSIPADSKYGPGGRSRYLHRCAVKDLLPQVIALGSKYTGQFVGRRYYDAIEEGNPILAPHPLLQSLLNEENFDLFMREHLLMDVNDPASLAQMENYEQFIRLNHWLHHSDLIRRA
jgi:asparagine synthase (glutamine-hydrolysing)